MKKKKVMKKSRTNSVVKTKMTLKDKEFMAVSILAVFVFAFLLAVVNTPQQSVTITGHGVEGLEEITASQVGGFLSNLINPEKADPIMIKWVVFFTFALGLWGGMSLFFKPGKGGAIKLLSLPIAFAMVYLLNPSEIFSALVGYSALGMTILVIIPFLAIIFFSVKLLERESPMRTITEVMVWYFYLAFLIYYLIRAFLAPETYNLWVLIIITIGILITILAIIKNKPIREWIHQLNIDVERKDLERTYKAKLTQEREHILSGRQASEYARR